MFRARHARRAILAEVGVLSVFQQMPDLIWHDKPHQGLTGHFICVVYNLETDPQGPVTAAPVALRGPIGTQPPGGRLGLCWNPFHSGNFPSTALAEEF